VQEPGEVTGWQAIVNKDRVPFNSRDLLPVGGEAITCTHRLLPVQKGPHASRTSYPSPCFPEMDVLASSRSTPPHTSLPHVCFPMHVSKLITKSTGQKSRSRPMLGWLQFEIFSPRKESIDGLSHGRVTMSEHKMFDTLGNTL
jgi:hypothetical protein